MAKKVDAPQTFAIDALSVRVHENQETLADDVAAIARKCLVDVLKEKGSAAVILATGNSQIQFLASLIALGGVDWSKVTLFHMDEYLGIDGNHPASFRRYMRERVASRIQPRVFNYIVGDCLEPFQEAERYSRLIKAQPIDLCCLGIGENGHIAFNDPPVADFGDPHTLKLVKLDDACKWQQVNEGHFPSLESVPPYAFTLTIPTLCSAKRLLCICPEKRKADAVKAALDGPIDESCPASILRKQSHATLFLDRDSAARLERGSGEDAVQKTEPSGANGF